MGLEYRIKGINVILGPTIGPLGRIITSGRNWESYSNDPYLSGKLVAETVQATQGVGVITSTKHFIVNEVLSNHLCHYSCQQENSKSPTEFQGRIAVASPSSLSHQMLMIKHYMSSTCGRSKKLYVQEVATSCVVTIESITRTRARTVRSWMEY